MMRRVHAVMLIEVLAALVILSTAVVGMLLAQSRSVAGMVDARDRSTAADLAGDLLAEWRLTRIDVRVTDEGLVENRLAWSWRRSSRPVRVVDEIVMREVTLEMFKEGADGQSRVVAEYRFLEPQDDDRAKANP